MATNETPLKDLYPAIRAIVGDNDPVRFLFPDRVIDQHIILFAACNTRNSFVVSGVEGSRVIAVGGSSLASQDSATVILNAARSLISPTPDFLQFKGPVISTARKGGTSQILANIDRMLAMLKSGKTISWETELELIAIGDMRLLEATTAAQSADTAVGNPSSP